MRMRTEAKAMSFDQFFQIATSHAPYVYQRRLACGEQKGRSESECLGGGDPHGCRSRLINIPTGLGKTAAVVLAWLWNRVGAPSLNPQPPITNFVQSPHE